MKHILIFLILMPLLSFSQKVGDTSVGKCFIKVCNTKTSQCRYVQGYGVEKCTKVIYKDGKAFDWEWKLVNYLDENKRRINPKGKVIVYIESMM